MDKANQILAAIEANTLVTPDIKRLVEGGETIDTLRINRLALLIEKHGFRCIVAEKPNGKFIILLDDRAVGWLTEKRNALDILKQKCSNIGKLWFRCADDFPDSWDAVYGALDRINGLYKAVDAAIKEAVPDLARGRLPRAETEKKINELMLSMSLKIETLEKVAPTQDEVVSVETMNILSSL